MKKGYNDGPKTHFGRSAFNYRANFDCVLDLRGEAGALSEGIMEIDMREDFRAHKGMVAAARSDFIFQIIGSPGFSFP